jgi:hypothetical protein
MPIQANGECMMMILGINFQFSNQTYDLDKENFLNLIDKKL